MPWKRRAVAGFLVLFGLWPGVQYGLTAAYGVSPWKLVGFAMYCVPGAMRTVRVVGIAADGSAQLLPPSRYSAEEEAATTRFRIRRQALGELASPEPLGWRLLELHPEWQGVALPVLSVVLDPETALTRFELEQHVVWRDGSDRPFEVPIQAFAGS